MSESCKVGLLGAGYILDAHAKALQSLPHVTLSAICDISRARAAKAASRYGIAQVFDSIDALAASDCDVVHVLLPPPLHIGAAAALIQAGKSVFLEKPMGLDSSECAALSAQAAERRVALGVNHNFLFSRGYESLRAEVKSGALGRIDSIHASWHFALPLLQFGPFDSWPVAAPANLIYELGSHLGAFLVDLMGAPRVLSADAGCPLVIPGGQTIYRHWSAVLRAGATTALLSLSVTTGHAERTLQLRCRGGSAVLDFGRDIFRKDTAFDANPIFDAYSAAHIAGKALQRQARADRIRRLGAALRKQPDANPFEESVFRSIRRFYERRGDAVDSRHSAELGTEVIRLCESIASVARVGRPVHRALVVELPRLSTAPSVLVVGGSGFIGRRLVRRLVAQGRSVRLMTRNPRAAALELEGLPVELFAGSHGDEARVREALDGIDAVYHLAKCEGKRWQDYVEGDIAPTRVLAEAALAANVRRFIYTGTIASYAAGDARTRIDNHTPVDPRIARRDHYARSKGACETLLQDLQRARSLPLVIFRPGIVLGVGSPPAHPGVAAFMSEARVDYWGDGSSALPLVLVDDVADALLKGLEAPGIEGQTFLLTSPPLLTAREYVAALAECMNTRIDARPRAVWRDWAADMVKELAKNAVHHPNRRWPSLHDWRSRSNRARFDSSLTEQILGWRPVSERQTMIAQGIAEPVEWYLR